MKQRRRLQPQVQPDLVPMIDIVFQLVVFFMISSTFVVAPGIGIELPESNTSEQVNIDTYHVSLSENGDLFFQDEAVKEEQLIARLSALSSEEKERVIVNGDRNVSLQEVVGLLNVLRDHGIKNASILAKNPMANPEPGSQ